MNAIILVIVYLASSWVSCLGLQLYHQHMNKVSSSISRQQNSHVRSLGSEQASPSISSYTAYMHIFTVDGNNNANNWNATLVEYFLKLSNGNSKARDDNFYIAFNSNGMASEDSVQMNFCYADQQLQDSFITTYPTNISQQICIKEHEEIYEQGCVSYFENLPIANLRGSCVSPYTDEEGDNYVIDYPGIVFLQYCMKKGSTSIPHFYRSMINNVTMTVIFSLFSDQEPPSKVFDIPEICGGENPSWKASI